MESGESAGVYHAKSISGRKVLIFLVIMSALFVGGWMFIFGRLGLWVKVVYRSEVVRLKDNGMKGFMDSDKHYEALRIAVQGGDGVGPLLGIDMARILSSA